jgi:YVTN family beta-propeller protein
MTQWWLKATIAGSVATTLVVTALAVDADATPKHIAAVKPNVVVVPKTPATTPRVGVASKPATKLVGLIGMPELVNPKDVYAADGSGMYSPAVQGVPYRIYVPNTLSNSVTVIDPKTYKVIKTVKVGWQPQHVVPSWDLKTLWVNNDLGNSLTPINPRTGHFGKAVPVHDPYNLYFTPNGKYAVVMASKDHQLVFRDPHTMKVKKAVYVQCAGVNHADWTADGTHFLVSCEFSGQLLWVNTAKMKIDKYLWLPKSMSKPQDVKLSADGKVFYVADMNSNGVWVVDAKSPRIIKFMYTGLGAHGLYPSRDGKTMYISNRGEGTISVLRFSDRKLIRKIHIQGGGSPDMGGVSPDGKILWMSGRYSNVVYAIVLATGHTIRIRVGSGPHGLAVFPQPGRYSLGHTGVYR